MKRIKNYKGLTLVEIIISLAILGIIIVAFSTVLSTGFISIIRSGHRAEAAYESQKEMSTKIIEANDFSGTQNLNLNFSGGPSLILNVSIIESEEEINGNISTMTSFIPTP